MSEDQRGRLVELPRPRCPFCRDEVGPDDPKQACGDCMAWHHGGCWTEHGGCSTCGRQAQAVGQAARCVWPGCDQPPSDLTNKIPVRVGSTATAQPGRLCLAHVDETLARERRFVRWWAAVMFVVFTVVGTAIFASSNPGSNERVASVLVALLGPVLVAAGFQFNRLQRSKLKAELARRRGEVPDGKQGGEDRA